MKICIDGAGVEVETPIIDAVLGLTRQMGRVAGVYPVHPEAPVEQEFTADRV